MRALILSLVVVCTTPTLAAPAIKFHVNPKVSSVAQTGKRNGCWAASAAMVWGWKNHQSIGMEAIAKKAGTKYAQLLANDSVLSETDVQNFADAIGLVAEAPKSYTVKGFQDLLKNHGPLWFGTEEAAGKHARVVTGIEGDGSVDGTLIYFIDPSNGQATHDTFRRAMEKYETVATGTIGEGADLTIQIFHP